MMTSEIDFIHRFEPGSTLDAPPLLLLHGTGGDEHDLLQLGRTISPGSALLSPRGKVLEHGMPRFFRRLEEGIFDEADVYLRAAELASFVIDARKRYDILAPIALGYSNGANIAAAMLLLYPDALAGAILLRPMVPLKRPPEANLSGKNVLIVSGQHDPIIPASNAAQLATMLTKASAQVQHHILPSGHQLSQDDVMLAQTWLKADLDARAEAAMAQ